MQVGRQGGGHAGYLVVVVRQLSSLEEVASLDKGAASSTDLYHDMLGSGIITHAPTHMSKGEAVILSLICH